MKFLLAIAALVLGAHAACWDIAREDDHLVATCFDEVTEVPFRYAIHDVQPSDDVADLESLADEIYAGYESFRSNVTSTALAERSNPFPSFSDCQKGFSGVCTKVGWTGLASITSVGTLIVAAWAAGQQNNKLGTKPDTYCYKNNSQQACIGWYHEYYDRIDKPSLKLISDACAQSCVQQGESCVTEVNCIDNHAVKCNTKPAHLRECD